MDTIGLKLTVADPGFQKRGGGPLFFFFFFCFSTRKGVGDNFAKKKKETNHRRVFNIAGIDQNIPVEIPGRWGGSGGPPPENF